MMQQMEVADYVNERPRREQKRGWDATQTERRLCQLLFLSFGVLCIVQAILNVSLRLTGEGAFFTLLSSSKESTHSDCNTTHFCVQNNTKMVPKDCEGVPSGCVSSQQCPADWSEINSRCYFLSTEKRTWEDSRKYCQSKDADLVVIDSEQEQEALYRLGGDAYLLFWIGLKHTPGTNRWKWVDGSLLTKPFWQSGQPDRGGPNNVEDCVEMYHHNPVQANWNDAPCGAQRRWLCERNTYSLLCETVRVRET